MSLHNDDPLLSKLRELPAPALDPAARARTRRAAERAFAEEPPSGARSVRLGWMWSRTALSAVLAISAVIYVSGAVTALGKIYVAAAP
jgi:hypothetical protein